MFGVPNGLIVCNNGRLDEINKRIEDRNTPSQPLKPAFSLRPQLSKYNYMPIVNDSLDAKVGFKQYVNYDTKHVFNPGTSAPWYGFANNVNTESSLRNQFFALQDCEQATYIPGSNSSLYVNHNVNPNVPAPHQNQLLFAEPQLAPFNPNECQLENTLWQNNTRVAVKNIPL